MIEPADVPAAADAPRPRFPARAFQPDPDVRCVFEPPSHRAGRRTAVVLLVGTALLVAWWLVGAGAAAVVIDVLVGYLDWLPLPG